MFDVRVAAESIEKVMKEQLAQIDFDSSIQKNDEGMYYFYTEAKITIENHDDEILFQTLCFESGRINFYFVFDKLEEDEDTLSLLNQFNVSSDYLCATINDDGYLELKYQGYLARDKDAGELFNEIMSTCGELAENEIMQELTELTEE